MYKDDFILEICQGVETCLSEQHVAAYPNHKVLSHEKLTCHLYSMYPNGEDYFFHTESYNSQDISISGVQKAASKITSTSEILQLMNDKPYVSIVYANCDKVVCKTDYWGLYSCYYYRDAKRFILTNNIYRLAKILHKSQDQESLYELLFFNSLRGEKTLFEDIHSFLPKQAMYFDIKNNNVQFSGDNQFEELFDLSGSIPMRDAYDKFFEKAKNAVADPGASLSSGSDSRTVVSCLLKHGMNPKIYSWGEKNYVETQKVAQLAKAAHLDVNLISMQSFGVNFDDIYLDSMYLANGLLASAHHTHFYRQLPKPVTMFEGFLGSEFIKAVLSEGMASYPFAEVISKNKPLPEVMEKYFGDFDPAFRKKMEQYLQDKFSSIFLDINVKENYPKLIHYAYSHIPSKRMSGICTIAKNLGIKQYLPFLDIDILKATFNSGFGVANYSNLNKINPGTVGYYKPEAIIVKHMHPKLYRAELGTDFSFKETLEYPEKLTLLLKKARSFRDRYKYKNCYIGHVDFSRINQHILETVSNLDLFSDVASKPTIFKYSYVNNALFAKYMISRLLAK